MQNYQNFRFSSYKKLALFTLISLGFLLAFNTPIKDQNRIVSVAADKMNVMYIGVENPLTIAVEGILNKDITVSSDELQIVKKSNGKYVAIANQPGKAYVKVVSDKFGERALEFRVKRIPDPTAVLVNDGRNSYKGTLSPEEFKKYKGVDLFTPYFEFDLPMEIKRFHLTRVPVKGDPVEVINRSGVFNENAKSLVEKAQSGDVFYVDKVTARVKYITGDPVDLKLNSMVFKIK